MKTKVDIVSGFLDSGKTTFINGMLENKELLGERIVIIQCESGETEIHCELIKDKKVFIKNLDKDKLITQELIDTILDKYYPNRIIIEHNGMSKLEILVNIFEDRQIRKKSVIKRSVY